MSNISPEHWFLLPTQRHGINGRKNVHIHPYTSRNLATPLIDGKKYMEALVGRVSSLISSQYSEKYFHLSGWRVTPEVYLLGKSKPITLKELLQECILSNVNVRFLMWLVTGTNFEDTIENITNIDLIPSHSGENLEIAKFIIQSGGEALLDSRLPKGNFSSHHQKFIILGDEGSSVAFLGGIDLALDRWDDQNHSGSTDRQKEAFSAWHDVQVQIEGPAVAQIWQSFTNRWNDERPANNSIEIGSIADPIDIREKPDYVEEGSHHVQLLHTYPCKSTGKNYPFAEEGDYAYEVGMVKAIHNAEHYIYIEDQYFWPCAVIDALAEVVKAKTVTVIILVTHQSDVPALDIYHNYLRQEALNKITNNPNNKGKIYLYHLQQKNMGDDIYVHAKTMIIDDRYALIGTANVNQRSMRNDTEIGVAIVDSETLIAEIGNNSLEVCKFAREYRMSLWEEHLGVGIKNPLTHELEPNFWPKDINNQINHVLKHDIPKFQFCAPSFLPNILMNAETICNRPSNTDITPFNLPIPLSYFEEINPFSQWLKSGNTSNINLWKETYLSKFETSMEYETSIGGNRVYIYDLEFLTEAEVKILLPSPKGVLLIFGGKKFNTNNKAILSIKIIQNMNKDGSLGDYSLGIRGDLRFKLPTSLVKKVSKDSDKWKILDRPDVEVSLGDSVIYYKNNKLSLSSPLAFNNNVNVMICHTQVIGRLNKVDISYVNGSAKLDFTNIEILD